MFRIVCLLVFFQCLVCSNISYAQYLKVDTTKYIVWNEERPITWTDYPLLETQAEFAQALTAVTHSVRGGISKGKPKFEVYVLFKKEDSWTTDRTDMGLFEHEKLHFDIAEIYGRMLRKQIEAMGAQGIKDLAKYKKAIKFLLTEFKVKSADYDKDTSHGMVPDTQEKWKKYALSEMQRLHKYR